MMGGGSSRPRTAWTKAEKSIKIGLMQKEGNQPDSELQVLFIAHDFPPCADVGARRAIGFCRYLPEYRVQPVVLTVQGHLYERRDEDLAIPSGIRIYRTTVITNPLDWYGRWKVRGAPA